MLANVFTKTIRDRWLGMMIGAFSLAVLLLGGMAIYRSIDIEIYRRMPEAFRVMMNIPANTDLASLAYGAIYTSYGALTVAALAISMGSASIAGEERNGTIGLLLSHPLSRTRVLADKIMAMVAVTVFGIAILWGAAIAVPAMLGVNVGGIHIAALMLHMLVITLFFGFLAMAVSAATGKRGTASGTAAGILVLSFFATGLFPVIEGWENVAKAFPWYYYSGSQPHLNGVDWGHLAVLVAGIVVFAAVAFTGLARRDLRDRNVGVTILDILRSNPKTQKIVERLAGSTRVSNVWLKTASEHQGMLIVTAYVMFLVMGVVIGPLYGLIDDLIKQFGAALPPTLLAVFGGGDMSRPEGFYQIETFGMMAPIAVMLVTVTIGARALAGEERDRTMGLLLANPIPRSKIVLEKTAAMVLYAVVVGFSMFAGVWTGSALGRLGMSAGNIAATCLLVTLLGLAFGALALAVGAATGKVKVAAYTAVGVGLVSHFLNAFLPLSESTATFTKWTPFAYYLNSDPLINGMDWSDGLVLVVLTVVLVGLAVVLFQRRDLRQAG